MECKSQSSTRHVTPKSKKQKQGSDFLDKELTKSDINKFISFCSTPEKYATGSVKASEKVEYLNSIKDKLGKEDQATYSKALRKYNRILLIKGYEADYEESTDDSDDFEYEDEDEGEEELGLLKDILKRALDDHRSVKISYKGAWRTIDPYSLNDTYVVSYCHLAKDIRTFRIDRIEEAELAEGFIFDESLMIETQSRLSDAPKYKGGYRRQY